MSDLALTPAQKKNFAQIERAFASDRIVLLSVREKSSGKQSALICGVNRIDEEYEFVPFAMVLDGNPYEQFDSP